MGFLSFKYFSPMTFYQIEVIVHKAVILTPKTISIERSFQCMHAPPLRQPVALSAGGPGFNPQSRAASYQRRYKNGTSSSLVWYSTLKREINTGSFSRMYNVQLFSKCNIIKLCKLFQLSFLDLLKSRFLRFVVKLTSCQTLADILVSRTRQL